MCDDNLATIRKTASTATTVRQENSNQLTNTPFYPIIHSNWKQQTHREQISTKLAMGC